MLAIVLQILKILGIIILVLIGILVSGILILLFVPVRYHAKGYYRETYEVRAKVTWLMHVVSAQVVYSKEQALLFVIKLFGVTVFHNQKREAKRLAKETRKTKTEETKVVVEESVIEHVEKESDVQSIPEPATKIEPYNKARKEQVPSERSFFEKIRIVIEKFIQQIVNIKYTIRKIYATIKKVRENITFYTQLLQEDTTKEAFRICKKQLLRIVKNVKPKVFFVHIHLGMEDAPDTLGRILAIWGMLYPVHKGNIEMQAEFDQTLLEGDFYTKGRITLYVYLWTVYLFLFDKNIRCVKKSLLREEL